MIPVPLQSERGIVLPLALLLLVVLGFVATGAMFVSKAETRVSSGYSVSNNAVSVAEAAAEHGLGRLNELVAGGGNPDGVQLVADSLDRFAYTATVSNKREQDVAPGGRDLNGDGDRIDTVLYDRSFGYSDASATTAGYPVKLLVAEAADGQNRARVMLEIARDRAQVLPGPLTLYSTTTLTGSLEVDGRLYDRNGNLVPSGALVPPYGTSAQSKAAAKNDCNYWKAGIKIPSDGSLSLGGNMSAIGHVAFDHGNQGEENYDGEDSLSTFKFTPEELLGAEPGALDAYKTSAAQVDFRNLSGVNYITSGSVPSQISGSGILIIHNPRFDVKKYDCEHFPTTCSPSYAYDPENQPMELQINSNSNFSGIIITDDLVHLNGNLDVLGAVASLTTLPQGIAGNGNARIRWSCQAVEDAATLVGTGTYDVRLSWEHLLASP